MPRDVAVLLLAAGRGARAGEGEPKQFRPIAGVPMLLRALRPFASHPDVGQIVVALPKAVAASPPEWLTAARGEILRFVAGGASRRESVARALRELERGMRIVLVHDAARPFVSRETIDAVIAVAREGEGAVAAVPVSDTLKVVDPRHVITATTPREGLWRAQTPQGFPRAMLEDAHAHVAMDDDATDDAMLAEARGHRLRIVPDSPLNLKITSSQDFVLADALASRLA
ncbi:MAG TPA: 2-C-methyl-D-erythritol 4-phosphate cytidylyltransferase [Gemmatimonadales bacterium]|nr:2-C-methyl-D-erythritol 4-phosphate cytidylyltransferase [Gemmatimonadales bacterium]